MTVVYRKKALYPLYVYVFLDGLFGGFSTWWIPYLYIWTILWGITMLLPKNMNPKVAPIIYMIVCALHGFLFGTLFAPMQALFFNLDFDGTIAWIIAGLPYDAIHGVSNFICGMLIVPIIKVLTEVNKYAIKE
jgi:energy-coupling factor transport system substrate-specific component